MGIDYLLWLQGLREATGGALDALFLFISELGMETIPMVFSFILYWCVSKQLGTYLLFTFNAGAFLNGIAKLTAAVYRPWIRNAQLHPVEGALSGATGYSFPSGHSTTAVVSYGGCAFGFGSPRWFRACAVILVLLIMFSRNYLGVHTPQDVVVGAALGVVVLWLMKLLLRWADMDGSRRDLWIASIGTLICGLSIAYVMLKPYPMDMVDGALLVDPVKMQSDHFSATGAVLGLLWGWVWERHGVRFTVDAKPWQMLLRVVTGLTVALGLIYLMLRHALVAPLGKTWANLIGTTLALFYATAVHPFLFTRLEKWLNRPAAKCAKL